jgi:hypothetical protein
MSQEDVLRVLNKNPQGILKADIERELDLCWSISPQLEALRKKKEVFFVQEKKFRRYFAMKYECCARCCNRGKCCQTCKYPEDWAFPSRFAEELKE